jgi:nucleoside-diphosphate-sugar epimerase
MHIVGNGLIARHLRPLRDRHSGVTVLAAGVPRHGLPESENAREAALVRETIARCRADGHLLVFFSTTSMYGGPGNRGREDEPVVASTAYGQHKLDLETLIRDSGAEHLILRLTQVVGPEEPEFRLLPALMKQLCTGHIKVHRDARRDLLYITDVVAGLDGLLSARPKNETVNVASGDCVPIGRIIDHLEERLGVTAERQIFAEGVAYCSSVEKLRAAVPEVARLGFAPGYHLHAIDRYLEDARSVRRV